MKVLLEKSMVPERFKQFSNDLSPSTDNDIGAKSSNPIKVVGKVQPGLPHVMKALLPIDVILEGKDATSLWQFENPPPPMVVNRIALKFVMVMRFVHPLNAESPITASRLVEFRVTLRRFVRF